MKSFEKYNHNVNKLISFYKATIYAYDQTEEVLNFRGERKIPYDTKTEEGLLIKNPRHFKYSRRAKIAIRNTLCETVYIRLVSSLEIFLIDLVREVFLESKEPFMKQDTLQQFSHAELLSFKSTSEIAAKIINKECRKLSSGGFAEIKKFYKKHFDVEISDFAPGINKMKEYHDIRHLLVHRLGKTDQSFRKKYNVSNHAVSIDEDYLLQCVKDFNAFAELLSNQLNYLLQNEFKTQSDKSKKGGKRLYLLIEILKPGTIECLDLNFEFSAKDQIYHFYDILESSKEVDVKKTEFIIFGTHRQIKNYLRILKEYEIKKQIKLLIREIAFAETKSSNVFPETRTFATNVLDEKLLEEIKNKLPSQPWGKGIHKKIAEELNISNRLSSIGIQQLISRGVYKFQVNGKIVDLH